MTEAAGEEKVFLNIVIFNFAPEGPEPSLEALCNFAEALLPLATGVLPFLDDNLGVVTSALEFVLATFACNGS